MSLVFFISLLAWLHVRYSFADINKAQVAQNIIKITADTSSPIKLNIKDSSSKLITKLIYLQQKLPPLLVTVSIYSIFLY